MADWSQNGRRTIRRLGAGAFWVWSAYVVWKSTRAHGFYGAGLVLGLSVVLLTLRLEDRPNRRELLLLGLALGLGWWATPQVFVIALPSVAWLLWRRRELLRSAWLVLGAALVGSLAWFVSNVRHDWYSLNTPPRGGSLADSIHNLLAATLPTALGARVPFTLEWVGGAVVGACLYAVLLAAIVWTLVSRRTRLGPLVPVLVTFPAFYALSPYSWFNVEPRYLVAGGCRCSALVSRRCGRDGGPSRGDRLRRSPRSRLPASPSSIGATCRPPTRMVWRFPRASIRCCARWRRTACATRFADYWIAWRIVFESDERIISAKGEGRLRRGAEEQGRYPPFYREVLADPRAAYVFLAGSDREPRLRPRLLAAGYRPLRTGDFIVYLRS